MGTIKYSINLGKYLFTKNKMTQFLKIKFHVIRSSFFICYQEKNVRNFFFNVNVFEKN